VVPLRADLPDPDLLIRTSGELTYQQLPPVQLAYTEIVVLDVSGRFPVGASLRALREYSPRAAVRRGVGGRLREPVSDERASARFRRSAAETAGVAAARRRVRSSSSVPHHYRAAGRVLLPRPHRHMILVGLWSSTR